jgi:hypothetical protein
MKDTQTHLHVIIPPTGIYQAATLHQALGEALET